MSLTINIYYTGKKGSARKFVEEMTEKGIVDDIRAEKGNIKYEYFFPKDDTETVLLIDCWEDERALDKHHKSPMMKQIAELREKYELKMRVEQYTNYLKDNMDFETVIRKRTATRKFKEDKIPKEKLEKEFNLTEGIEPVCLIPLGYASDDYAGNPLHNQRKDLKETVEYL